MLAVPFVVTLAVTLCGLDGASYWRDESATVVATQRSLPGLLRMLSHEDAVHGFYYVLAWGAARVFGTSEIALRWPTAAAMATAALCVALIGRRLRSRRTGLLAGLVFACLPEVSLWGQNARSYAMVVAAAALSGYLVLGVIDHPWAGRLFGYGLSVTLLGYLNLVALLLVAAHAVTVATCALAGFGQQGRPGGRRGQRLATRWAIAAGAGVAAVTPVVVFGWRERIQIAWHAAPAWVDVQLLLPFLTAGSVISAVLFAILATLGIVRCPGPGRLPAHLARLLAWLCVPWLVLPPSILFAASQWQIHLYGSSYLLFLLPAVALLAGAGLAALPAPGQVVALGLIVILALPMQVAIRRQDGHGDDLRGAVPRLARAEHGRDDLRGRLAGRGSRARLGLCLPLWVHPTAQHRLGCVPRRGRQPVRPRRFSRRPRDPAARGRPGLGSRTRPGHSRYPSRPGKSVPPSRHLADHRYLAPPLPALQQPPRSRLSRALSLPAQPARCLSGRARKRRFRPDSRVPASLPPPNPGLPPPAPSLHAAGSHGGGTIERPGRPGR
jgi:mannosyltransferase